MTGGFRNSTHLLPREAILAAGAFTALGTGAIYMWSIFNKPLMEKSLGLAPLKFP